MVHIGANSCVSSDKAASVGYARDSAQYAGKGTYYSGRYDDEGFGANISCCECGGGLQDCLEMLFGNIFPGPNAMSLSNTTCNSRFSCESYTASLWITPPILLTSLRVSLIRRR